MIQDEKLYHISQPTLIAGVLESLADITFADTKEDKQMYKGSLELKLMMLMPESLKSNEDKLLCTLIVFSAGYAGLEEIEIKALQMFRNIGIDNVYARDITTIPRDEEHLKILSKEIIIPCMLGLGVDVEMEFKELEAMRTHLKM